MSSQNPVPKLYRSVVDDVINNVREAFLDEGVDEQVLQELKQLWESKLYQSKAVEGMPAEHDQYLQQFAALAQPQQPKQQQAQQRIHVQQVPQQSQPRQQTPQQPQQPQQQPQQGATALPTIQIPLFTNLGGTLDISNAAAAATIALPVPLYQQQLQALQAQGITLQQTSTGQFIAIQQAAQPQAQATGQPVLTTQPQFATVNPQHIQTVPVQSGQQSQTPLLQLDGANDTSSEEEDDDDKDDDDDDQEDEENEYQGEEEEPLNSGDDVSEEDPTELFETDNVVVCQYDKINRAKNRWKFHLKDGIMNLNGKDYVFQKATGDAEW
ncbi:transcription initiation factor IIA subunit 1-like [Lingula anatina]|uniref:Transcription initiation factor IIA subunit 1-like n=1 Tax=Lingula anatina TaxID=7574 RepID=A0A1S3ISP1_LINAN|nr:transcription initiation factor IIA subunit 1-like [Lingula anatina]|eukprot:XP_013401088.2 transcription initiation factor IIA subunit 1-like [Lingula anatina]